MRDPSPSPLKTIIFGLFYFALLFDKFSLLPQGRGYILLAIIGCAIIVIGVHRILVPFKDAKDILSEDLITYSKWYGVFTILSGMVIFFIAIDTKFGIITTNLMFSFSLFILLIILIINILVGRFYRKRKKNEGENIQI